MLRYRGLLFSVCRRYSRDGLEVDDLLQETTLVLWNLREQLFSITLLPEPDRTIVTMHLEGYEYKEIGHKTGLTKNHVGIRLMRIKDKLKQQWNTI